MFYVHPDGTSGELPDGSPLPDGAEQVNRGQYLKHQRDQQLVADQAVVALQVEDRQSQLEVVAAQASAVDKLVALGFTDAEAALIVGGGSS